MLFNHLSDSEFIKIADSIKNKESLKDLKQFLKKAQAQLLELLFFHLYLMIIWIFYKKMYLKK